MSWLGVRLIACTVALLGPLAGCGSAPPLTGQAQADAATVSACRRRADEAYDRQNRAEIYSQGSQVNTPYSASYTPNQTDNRLSQLFSYDKRINDCVRNTGTGTERDEPIPRDQQ